MHQQAYDWVARHATDAEVAVLDICGRDINGTPRGLFPNATRYVVLDAMPGEGVDIVADAAFWKPDRAYDVVVCCEVFEHTGAWPGICVTAYRALRPGGAIIVTCAGPGRAAHSAVDGGPDLYEGEHYANVDPDDLKDQIADAGFADITVEHLPGPGDVRAYAIRPDETKG